MTVMPSGSNVADKAVSTEDMSEMVCLNAILATLVENKLQAIRAATAPKRRWANLPFRFKKSRSSSPTVPSCHYHCCCHHHHHHYHEKHKHKKDFKHHKKPKRRFDSTPCEEFISDQDSRTHLDDTQNRRRISNEERDEESLKRIRRELRISNIQSPNRTSINVDSPIELMSLNGIPDYGSLVEMDRDDELFDNSEDYPGLHRSAYLSQSDPFLYIDYDDEDYMALDLADEVDELEDSLYYSGVVIRDSPQEQGHPPRRKRKRKQHQRTTETSEVPEVMLVNRDELPPRAKWTIVATACLLFAMSLILVGVTLRMAPIIDDMGPNSERIVFYADDVDCYHERLPDFRQELMSHGLYPPSPRNRPRRSNSVCSQSDRPKRLRNAEAGHRRRNSVHGTRSRTNSCSRPTPLGDGRRASVSKKLQRRPSTIGVQRKNSVRQTKLDDPKKKKQIIVKSPMELEQARKYRRVIFSILGTIIFLIVASILVVVVTLTNNSFHIPPISDQEFTKHRMFDLHNNTFRKENEELLNSLNQDTTVPQNSTVPP